MLRTSSAPRTRKEFETCFDHRCCVISTVMLLCTGLGVHYLHAFQVRRTSGFYLELAARKATDGHTAEATRFLREYLAIHPDDFQALSNLAELQFASAQSADDFRRCFQLLERALRIDPKSVPVQRMAAEAAVQTGQFRDAIYYYELLTQSAQEGEHYRQLALCYEQNLRYRDAARAYARAIELDPSQPDTYRRLSDVLRNHLNEPGNAEKVLSRAAGENPEMARATSAF